MSKYKNILSIAAAVAISSTMLTANYIPLTSTANGGEWVLFGAAGFQTDGTSAVEGGAFRIIGSAANTIIDESASDALPVAGLTVGGNPLAYLDSYDTAVPLEVRVDVTGIGYVETEPYRTIYVDATGDGAPNFAFTYKSALENMTLEYSINGGLAQTVTIDYANTFSSPALGTVVPSTAAVAGTTLSQLEGLNNIVDYDFSDNPPVATGYTETDHYTAAAQVTDKIRLYEYNAQDNYWEIFDSLNTVGTNDFTEITAGKGYWGRMVSAGKEGGMVFGTPGLTSADYTNANLQAGWNLMAFDGVQSRIRNATTGLIVTCTAAGGAVTFVDSTGNHELTITIGAGDTGAEIARNINTSVEQAKLFGTMPYTFDLRAFPTDTLLDLSIISNKKFTIKDDADTAIEDVKTLAGQIPIDPSTDAVFSAALTDLGAAGSTDGARSVYGEYSLLIEPLIGAGTAQPLSAATAAVFDVFSPVAPTTPTRVTVANSVAGTATAIGTAITDFTGTKGLATAISTDMNDTVQNHILMSSVAPFKLRDATFSRVYKFIPNTIAGGQIRIDGSTTIDIDSNTTASDGATNAAATIVAAGKIADSDPVNTDEVVIISNGTGKSEFAVYETGAAGKYDIFQTKAVSTDLSRGAVKAVYSLDYLAKKDLRNDVTIALNSVPDDVNDTIRFDYVTEFGTITGTTMTPNSAYDLNSTGSNATSNLALYEAYILQINQDLLAAGLTATADHNYSTANANITSGLITLAGSDVKQVTETTFGTGASYQEDFNITITAGDEDGNDTTFSFNGKTITLGDTNNTATLIATALTDNTPFGSYVVTNVGASVNFKAPAGHETDVVVGDLVFTDGATADATAIAFTFDGINQQGTDGAAETAATLGATLGFLGTLAADIESDLRYNQVLSPNYVMDGPLYTMKDNDFALKALVTGTMDLTDGTVGWDSIDLTRLPSEWLDSQDYDLFTVDPKAGYWAYLEADATVTSMAIGTAVLSKNYVHHFDTDGTTYNSFSGTIDVEVTGITTADAGLSARVTATVNGKTVELSNDAGTNTFTGVISTNEINGLVMNTGYEVFVNVADGLGNKIEKSFADLFDNVKPSAPTVTIDTGTVSISSDDTTITGFYVFGGAVPEIYATGDELAILATAGDVGVVCEQIDAVDANSPAGGLSVVAFDQGGLFNQGNASDSQSVAFMPILKSRAMITDANVGDDTTPTADGDLYDASCTNTGAITTETGIAFAAMDTGTIAKMAYTYLPNVDAFATPITQYVTNGVGTVRITYPSAYTGDHVFLQINGNVYGYILTGVDSTTGSPDSISIAVKTDITLD